LFTPSLFFGALIGGALGHLAALIFPSGAPTGAYALVGMGAVLAGTTHASISAVLIIFELTGDYGVILPLMLTCILASAVSRRLEPHSLYTAALARRRVKLPEPHRPHWLRGVRIAAFLQPAATVPSSAPFRTVIDKIVELPAGNDLYVVGPDGRYAGTIVLERIKAHLPDGTLLQAVIAADVMERIEPLPATLSIGETAALFSETSLDKLPIVHPGTGEVLGAVSKTEILRLGRF
jgi:CIC family chloride channel protein